MKLDAMGKRVLVTAGASGIGYMIAKTFADNGSRVHMCDIDKKALASARTHRPDIGVTLCDVSDPEQVDNLFRETTADLGGLDILLNNAGIGGPTILVEDIEVDDWNRTIAVGLNAQFYCARKAIPLLKQAGDGLIINMSSSAGLMGYPMRAPYCAAKWAVIGFTKTLAMELGEFGIRANAICPGNVTGERMVRVLAAQARKSGLTLEEERTKTISGISMHTFVSPEEIANLALYLASDAGRRITGQALSVDGHTETLR